MNKKYIRWLSVVFAVVFALFLGAVIFIKFYTAEAAAFTDNYLRPIVGDNVVIHLEKAFFNASDKAQQIEYRSKTPEAPVFTDSNQQPVARVSGGMTLSDIPTENFSALPKEGVWLNRRLTAFPGSEVAANTFTRPDPSRPYAIVTLLKIDMSKVSLGSVAGIKQPGGQVGKPGPGKVPGNIVASGKLIAAFDGGFQYRDGAYGMIVGDTTYLPLKNDLATLVGYRDGTLKLVDYTGQNLGSNIAFVRQNCPMLIENGQISILDPAKKSLWGRTPTSSIYTWRSGIGLDANGNLVFAVGNNLTPLSLATALKSAGALNAMQLDINPSWVRFNFFEHTGGSDYTTATLTRDLKDGSKDYLNGYEKDFFYLYQK